MTPHPIIPEAPTDHIARKLFDQPYANVSPTQKLDIYWPDQGDGPFPVIIAIHGGAFLFGDKRDVQVINMLSGLSRGYAVVSINYRMSEEAIFPALVQDVRAAIRWVRANAERLMLNPAKIAVWGSSAGGYLALMAGVAADVPALDDLSLGNAEQPSHVQAVVAFYPPTDFGKMDEQLTESGMAPSEEDAHSGPNSPESLSLGGQVSENPQLVQAANPESYIRVGLPPFFIQHGTLDDVVPYQQSVNMAAKLTAVLGPQNVTLELLPGARHAEPAFDTPENRAKVLDFLDRTLQP